MTDKDKVLKALYELSQNDNYIAYQEVELATGLSHEILDKILCNLNSDGKLKKVQLLGGKVPMIFKLS